MGFFKVGFFGWLFIANPELLMEAHSGAVEAHSGAMDSYNYHYPIVIQMVATSVSIIHFLSLLYRDGDGNILDPELSSPVELFRQHSLSSESRTR